MNEKTVAFEDAGLQAGFTIVPNRILLDRNLTTTARLTWAILAYFAREKEECWPGQERLAVGCGCSVRTMVTCLQELERNGLIKITRRGQGRTNLYRLCIPRSAKSAPPKVQDLRSSSKQLSTNQKKQTKQERQSVVDELRESWWLKS